MADAEIMAIAQVKPLKINEGSPLRRMDLKSYIDNPDDAKLDYSASLASGGALPAWLSLSEDGVLSGHPPQEAAEQSPYSIKAIVVGPTNKLEFNFEVKVYKPKTPEEIAKERQQAWETLAKQGVLPESLQEIIERPLSERDIYYLLQRYASLTIWNADDLRLAENGKQIDIADISEQFNVYDFEVCLVATPKDLYSYDRTLGDALQTARGMAKEVHRRQWHVELGGLDRMADAAWYEIYDLNQESEHQMEVRNYEPTEVKELMAQEQAKTTKTN